MSVDVVRAAILDPLSLLGKELRQLLPESGLPLADVALLGGGASVGTLSEYAGEPRVVKEVSEEELRGTSIVFSCGGPELLEAAMGALAGPRTALLVDLAGTLPASPGPAVLVSGVNDRAAQGKHLFRAPAPTTVLLATLFDALAAAAPVERFHAVTLEPVAGHGARGLDELYEQTKELLSFRSAPDEVLGERIAFNVAPVWGEAAREREQRIAEELRTVLGGSAPAGRLSVLRVPVFLGISVDVWLELESEEDARAVPDALAEKPRLRLLERPALPGDLPDGGEDDPILVSVGEPDASGQLRVWLAADPVRRCAVRNALEALQGRVGS